jgi:hypothetical protein
MRITCKEASRLISAGLDRELAFGDRAALRLHLALCSACNTLKSQFEFLRRALTTYSRPERDDD